MGYRVRHSWQDRWPGLGQTEGEGGHSWAPARGRRQRRRAAQGGLCASPQETSIPEELLVTVVKPGLPTVADLAVLLPPPGPTRKRSLTSDKVPPEATGPTLSLHHRGFGGLVPRVW